LFRPRYQDSQIFHATLLSKFAHHSLCHEFVRLKIDMQMKISHALRSRRSDCGDLCRANLARVVVKLEEHLEKGVDAVRTREHDPVVGVRVLNELAEFAQVGWRFDSNRWQFDNIRSERAKLTGERASLLSGSRNHDSFPRQRPLLVPI